MRPSRKYQPIGAPIPWAEASGSYFVPILLVLLAIGFAVYAAITG